VSMGAVEIGREARIGQPQIRKRLAELGKWFHNIDLNGVQTAPDHFLGDFPSIKWSRLRGAIPADLTGKSVLDIGCNGGFYSMEMKRRGAARVLGIDADPDYLAQARFAAEVYGLDIEFQEMSVYDVASLKEQFDLVLFMGVLYHLRHPLLALDLLSEHVVKDSMVFQTLTRGSDDVLVPAEDYPFSETDVFQNPD
jgi:tRNA (mo5U34)-methyltransferase